MPTVLAELSYEAGVRALDLQERALEQLRARTGTLLAASSLTASFLGAQAIAHTSGLGILGGLALVSLAASIGLCVYVLLPKEGFTFSLNAPQVYEQLFQLRDDEEEIRRRLAYWLHEFWGANQVKIDDLGRYYLASIRRYLCDGDRGLVRVSRGERPAGYELRASSASRA